MPPVAPSNAKKTDSLPDVPAARLIFQWGGPGYPVRTLSIFPAVSKRIQNATVPRRFCRTASVVERALAGIARPWPILPFGTNTALVPRLIESAVTTPLLKPAYSIETGDTSRVATDACSDGETGTGPRSDAVLPLVLAAT